MRYKIWDIRHMRLQKLKNLSTRLQKLQELAKNCKILQMRFENLKKPFNEIGKILRSFPLKILRCGIWFGFKRKANHVCKITYAQSRTLKKLENIRKKTSFYKIKLKSFQPKNLKIKFRTHHAWCLTKKRHQSNKVNICVSANLLFYMNIT